MNIEQYRALKAQEEKQLSQNDQTIVDPAVSNETTQTQTNISDDNNKNVDTNTSESKPIDKVEVPGIGEVTIDELKNGYLRQSDYTKKTQEVARRSREVDEAIRIYEHLKNNPQIAQQVFNQQNLPPQLDPTQSKIIELEEKLYDMMLEREIESLENKYDDFNTQKVLEIAHQKQITNLEDAYFIFKSQQPVEETNIDELKATLREEILNELRNEEDGVKTIISSGGSQAIIKDKTPKISASESKVARMMGMSDSEYAKWRDATK